MPNEYDLLQFFSQQTAPVLLEELMKDYPKDAFILTPLYELVKSGFVEEQEQGEDKQYIITEKGKEEQASREQYRT